jgi:uncharacterized protein (DUF488 family)
LHIRDVTEIRPTIFSIGHGARSFGAFFELLRGADVERVVDVRTAPGSRKHPHFGKNALAEALTREGIEYRWEGSDLGGFRKAKPDSRHVAIRNAGFRGYADHMETEEFRAARDRLIDTSRETRTAYMCAESVWWRCHRRMLSDALLVAGCDVVHLMDRGKRETHRLNPAARVDDDGTLVYDQLEGQQELTL